MMRVGHCEANDCSTHSFTPAAPSKQFVADRYAHSFFNAVPVSGTARSVYLYFFLYLPIVSEGVFEHSLPVAVIVVGDRIDHRGSRLNRFSHDLVDVGNKQTDHARDTPCPAWLKCVRPHGFVQMKRGAVEFEFCNVNAAVVVAHAEMFRCAQTGVKIQTERTLGDVEFGRKMRLVFLPCHALLG